MHDASMGAKNAIVMNECEGVMQGARSRSEVIIKL